MSKIHLLQVRHGDAFVIECNRGENHGIIVVDGGPTGCGFILQNKLKLIGRPDLLVLTHYDDDHIGGLLQYFTTCKDDGIIPAVEVWANCAGYIERPFDGSLSAKQGVLLSEQLDEYAEKSGLIWRKDIFEGAIKDFPFATIEVVSPTKKYMEMAIKKQEEEGGGLLKATNENPGGLQIPLDKLFEHIPNEPNLEKENEMANASSIALIARCDDLSVLMLGDCFPQNVEAYLRAKGFSEDNPLSVDYVKISHHGSRNNTSNELLDIIHCNNYIISTNGGKNHSNHPDRTTIAHILCHSRRVKEECVHLFFNYSLDIIEANGAKFIKEGEQEEWNFVIHENVTEL